MKTTYKAYKERLVAEGRNCPVIMWTIPVRPQSARSWEGWDLHIQINLKHQVMVISLGIYGMFFFCRLKPYLFSLYIPLWGLEVAAILFIGIYCTKLLALFKGGSRVYLINYIENFS
jgi:hypothetical protein